MGRHDGKDWFRPSQGDSQMKGLRVAKQVYTIETFLSILNFEMAGISFIFAEKLLICFEIFKSGSLNNL